MPDEKKDPNIPQNNMATPALQAALQGQVFYNVMPKVSGGGIVPPEITVAPKNDSGAKPAAHFNSRLIVYGILLLILIALGVVGWFIYQHYTALPPAPTIVVSHPPNPAKSAAATSSPEAITVASVAWQQWEEKYFNVTTCTDMSVCGPDADPDHDGLTNYQEFKNGTDPNNPDSDGDGIADGDEVNVFLSNPLQSHTANDPKYSDADDIKNGYDPSTDLPYSTTTLAAVKARIQQYGLHEPTIKTIGMNILTNLYGFSPTPAVEGEVTTQPADETLETASGTPSGLDESATAKQNRDAQRTNTVQNIAAALLKYYAANAIYPDTTDFSEMYQDVKPFDLVATNPVDPINQDPYVYTYAPNATDSDFTLTFFSETQNQIIEVTAEDAQKVVNQQQADENDQTRETDLETLRSALLLYSNDHISGNQTYIFPPKTKYKTALVPKYIEAVPVDPISGQDYDYEVSSSLDSFTIKATLQDPPPGDTGYECDEVQDCHYY